MTEKKASESTTREEKTETNTSPSFDTELKSFIAHIESLSTTLPLSNDAIISALADVAVNFNAFSKENISTDEFEGEKRTLIRAEAYQEYEVLVRQMTAYALALKTIPSSYIISLISQYDAFLGGLLRVVFLEKPELLNVSERKLTFAQLLDIDSIDDAKDFILEKEIESTLRKSHSDQFHWMEKKFVTPFRKDLEIWSDFKEITERRNLFVHTGGTVSRQYIKICKEHNVDLGEVSTGDVLTVTPNTLKKHTR